MVTCLVDFLFCSFSLFLFFFLSHVLIIASRSTTRQPTHPNHSPFRSHSLTLSFSLSSISLVTLSWTTLPTPRHYHAAAIRSLFHLFLAFPLCTYTYSIQLPSLAPPRSPLLYKLVLADEAAHMYIRQSSCLSKNKSIHPAVLCDQVVPSPSFLFISTHPRALPVSAIVQWYCCPHDPCRSLALVLPLSTHTHTHSLSFLSRSSLSYSWTTLPPSLHLS